MYMAARRLNACRRVRDGSHRLPPHAGRGQYDRMVSSCTEWLIIGLAIDVLQCNGWNDSSLRGGHGARSRLGDAGGQSAAVCLKSVPLSRKELQQLGSIGLQCWPRDRVITLLKVAGWSSASPRTCSGCAWCKSTTALAEQRGAQRPAVGGASQSAVLARGARGGRARVRGEGRGGGGGGARAGGRRGGGAGRGGLRAVRRERGVGAAGRRAERHRGGQAEAHAGATPRGGRVEAEITTSRRAEGAPSS